MWPWHFPWNEGKQEQALDLYGFPLRGYKRYAPTKINIVDKHVAWNKFCSSAWKFMKDIIIMYLL